MALSIPRFSRNQVATTFWGLVALIPLLVSCSRWVNPIEPRPICDFDAYKKELSTAAADPKLVPRTPGLMTHMPLNHLNVTDERIMNKVLVQTLNAERDEDGRIKVWARLVNCTDYPLQVEGRTHFLTEMQSPAEPISAWKRVQLPARTYSVYDVQSIRGKEAHSFLIELREGR